MIISLIAAVADNQVIGVDGDLPWSLPDDMRFFTRTTKGHHVLMGRKNYESIPDRFRPLPGRTNIVVTRNNSFKDDRSIIVHSIDEGIERARAAGEEELFIIGGGEIYQQTIDRADKLYITHVHGTPEGHAHFPVLASDLWNKTVLSEHSKDDVHNFPFTICVYDKK